MTVFINTETLEYPLFVGDIQPDFNGIASDFTPPEGFELVQEVPPPDCEEGTTWYEIAPAQIEGVWTQQFAIRTLSDEDKAIWLEGQSVFKIEAEKPVNPNIDEPGTVPDVIG